MTTQEHPASAGTGLPVRRPWDAIATVVGSLSPRWLPCRPNVMIVGPPKTATTTLSVILAQNHRLYSPTKETHYFSHFWDEYGIDTYVAQFRNDHRAIYDLEPIYRFEATPSYFILPDPAVRLIRALFPDLRLFLTLRDPIERAWSHLRHQFCWREGSFLDFEPGRSIDDVTVAQWCSAARHPVARIYNDYVDAIRTWRRHFPADRFLVVTSEQIAARGAEVGKAAFAHLGIDDEDDDEWRLDRRWNEGGAVPMPDAVRAELATLTAVEQHRLHAAAVDEFADIPGLREAMADWTTPPVPGDGPLAPIAAGKRQPRWDQRSMACFSRTIRHWSTHSATSCPDYEKLSRAVLEFETCYFNRTAAKEDA